MMNLVQGWLQILGPVTANSLASHLDLSAPDIFQKLLRTRDAGNDPARDI